jgi:hypothetical protein
MQALTESRPKSPLIKAKARAIPRHLNRFQLRRMMFPKVMDKPDTMPRLKFAIGDQATNRQKVFDFNWADDVEEELFGGDLNTMQHYPRDVSAKYIFQAWPTDYC